MGSHSNDREKHMRKIDFQVGLNETLLCLKHYKKEQGAKSMDNNR